jgi:hypothetical protein
MASMISQKDSRKSARRAARIFSLAFVLALIDIFVYDLPIFETTLVDLLLTMCLLSIGFIWGVSYVHGWPKQASEDFDLAPKVGYEEE